MERKELGNKLIILGLLLYIVTIIILGILSNYSNYIFMSYRYDSFIGETALIILGLVIVGIGYFGAFNSIMIGGIWAKKRIDYWLILIGMILFFSSVFGQWVFILESLYRASLISILTYFFPIQTNPIFMLMMMMILPISFICIIIGGLMKTRDRKEDIKTLN